MLCEIAEKKFGLKNTIWLDVSVLAHFLSKDSEPFSELHPSGAICKISLELQNPLSKEVRERRYSTEARYVDLLLYT